MNYLWFYAVFLLSWFLVSCFQCFWYWPCFSVVKNKKSRYTSVNLAYLFSVLSGILTTITRKQKDSYWIWLPSVIFFHRVWIKSQWFQQTPKLREPFHFPFAFPQTKPRVLSDEWMTDHSHGLCTHSLE